MSLILPPFYFAAMTDNIASQTPSLTSGTNFTAGANNADGAAVSVLSALSHNVHFLEIGISGVSSSGVDSTALLDVLIDPAGGTSWSQFISDLAVGFSPAQASLGTGVQSWYHFPILIPSGAAIGVQCRTAHTVDITTGRVVAIAKGNPCRPDMWWTGQRVESIGTTAASSSSTAITPGNTGTWGSWTNIGSTTANRYGCLQFGLNGTDVTATNQQYHFELGVSSTKLAGSPTIIAIVSANEYCVRSQTGPIWCDIPSGTQLQVRATCSGTAENIDVSLYGVY